MNKRKNNYGCAMCGKTVQFANRVSHAKNRTHVIRKPNLQTHRTVIDGQKVKIKLCTRCKRMARRVQREEQQVREAKKK